MSGTTKGILRMQVALAQRQLDDSAKRIQSLEAQVSYLIRGNMGMHDWMVFKLREIDAKFRDRMQARKSK